MKIKWEKLLNPYIQGNVMINFERLLENCYAPMNIQTMESNTNLEDLIQTTLRLTKRLEKAAEDERQFCIDIQMKLESLAWESYRMANELNEIKNNIS